MRTSEILSEFSYESEQQHMGFITSSQSLKLGVRQGILDDIASYGFHMVQVWLS